ncbi:MFP1 attachment factor 1 [Coffea eugenioides]|uniref:MFP1 attachment factor 1 n=1 Tax=Coffea eugenioides TaxID=49369 RepID=UPI000F60EA16|nr:MFP1 attachment factor 1 [Coffea eugenioides]
MTDNNNANSAQINLEETSREEIELPKTPTMAETEQPQVDQTASSDPSSKKSIGNVSFSIWPPTQRTRDAVINRLIETLSSPSVLSKRYGVIPTEEASEAAKRIEDEAYAAAGASASTDDDGIEILQIYSKEISRRMLDTVKSRSASAAADAPSSVSENKPQEDAADDGGISGEVEALKIDS